MTKFKIIYDKNGWRYKKENTLESQLNEFSSKHKIVKWHPSMGGIVIEYEDENQ